VLAGTTLGSTLGVSGLSTFTSGFLSLASHYGNGNKTRADNQRRCKQHREFLHSATWLWHCNVGGWRYPNYGQCVCCGSLNVAGSLTSSISNGQINFCGAAGNQHQPRYVYITRRLLVQQCAAGLAVNGTEKARIAPRRRADNGTFNSTNTTGTNSLSGHLNVLGNTTWALTVQHVIFNAQVASDIVPSARNIQLGSPTNNSQTCRGTTTI